MKKPLLIILIWCTGFTMRVQNVHAGPLFFCGHNLAEILFPNLSTQSMPSAYQYEAPYSYISNAINNSPGIEMCEQQKLWIGQVPLPTQDERTLLMYKVTSSNLSPPTIPLGTTLVYPYNGWSVVGFGINYNTTLQLDPGTYYFCLYASNGVDPYTAQLNPRYMKVVVNEAVIYNTPEVCTGEPATVFLTGCGVEKSKQFTYPGSGFLYYDISFSNGNSHTQLPQTTYYPPYPPLCYANVTYPIQLGSTLALTKFITLKKQFVLNIQNIIKPTVIGKNTTCNNNNQYQITNFQSSQNYTVQVSHGSATALNSNGEFTVNWQNFPNPGVATITVTTTTALGCEETTVFEVASCCNGSQSGDLGDPVVFANTTASQMLQTESFNNSNHQIVLNGTIIIDQNLTITNCQHVKMAPNALIIVNSGKTLNIQNSRLAGDECGYMWKGIIAPANDAIIKVYNSNIEDAITAVHAKQNAYMEAVNSQFINNDVCLKFTDIEPKEIAGPTQPQANGSLIYGNNFYTSGGLLPPSNAANKTSNGVLTDNIYQLNIGNDAQNVNNFHDISNAVYSENSAIVLKNNIIFNIAGSAVFFRNKTVYNSNGSVQYTHFTRMHAENNTFSNNMPNAIYGFGQLEAKNNTFKCRNLNSPAIWVREVAHGSYVENNTFSPLNGNTQVENTVAAVRLEKAMASPSGIGMKISVKDNNVKRYRSGIELTNTYGYAGTNPVYANNKVNVQDNIITVANNGSSFSRNYGIRLQHANGAHVYSNEVNRAGNIFSSTSLARAEKERGISVSQSQNALVTENQTENFGTGIWGGGDLRGTYFGCNVLQFAFYGFYFLPPSPTSNTILSNQGTPDLTTQNRWLDPWQSTGTFTRVAGQVNSTPSPEWHYNNTPNMYDADIALFSPTNIQKFSYHEVPQNNCEFIMWWVEDEITMGLRTDALGAIVTNQMQFDALQQEFAQYGQEYLFDMLTAEPQIAVTANANDDLIYTNWMDSISSTNIAKFYAVRVARDSGNITGALLANAEIIPQNTIEQNQKTANYYYLSKYIQALPFTYEDTTALNAIAQQTSYEGGNAVFDARVMLGIDPDAEGLSYKAAPQDEVVGLDYAIYPNPASHQLTVALNNQTFNNNMQLVLTNLLGTRMVEQNVTATGSLLQVDVSKLQTGMYILEVVENDKIIVQEKISIIK